MKKIFSTTILLFCLITSYAQGVYRDGFSNDAIAPSAPYWNSGGTYVSVSHAAGSGSTTITRGPAPVYSTQSFYRPYNNPEMGGGGTLISTIDMSNNNDTIFIIAKSSVAGTLLRIDIEDANYHISDNFITSAGHVNIMNQHSLSTSYTLIKYVYKTPEDGFSNGCSPNTPCVLNKAAIIGFVFYINPEVVNFSATVDIDYFQVGGSAPACPGGVGNLPTADAGPDVTVCAANPLGTFNGAATNANSTYWSSVMPGTYSAPASLSTTYSNGNTFLLAPIVLDVYSANGCGASDIALYIITQQAVNAGSDQALICNNPTAALNGAVTGETTTGTWSGGTGTYNPDANTLNATYTLSAAEIAAGTVTLTLSSVGGSCPVTDNVTINITASADAGIDQTLVCGNSSVTLNGSVTGATGGTWSGGGGAFTPNANTLNAAYFPSTAEMAVGTVTLTLTSTGGACSAASDNMTIFIRALANAGIDQTLVCGNHSATLNGSVTGATGGTWSGGTGTFSPNANNLNAVYTLSYSEIAAGTVTLTLMSSGGGCPGASDLIVINMNTCTAITIANKSDLFKIFPNPNKGDFTINMNAAVENAKIEIINTMGEIMISKSVTGNCSIDVNNLSKGMYSVKLTTQNNQYLLEKIIVE